MYTYTQLTLSTDGVRCVLRFPVVFKCIWYPFCWKFSLHLEALSETQSSGVESRDLYILSHNKTSGSCKGVKHLQNWDSQCIIRISICLCCKQCAKCDDWFLKSLLWLSRAVLMLQVYPSHFPSRLSEVAFCFHAHLETHSSHVRYDLKLTQSYSAKRINETYQMKYV